MTTKDIPISKIKPTPYNSATRTTTKNIQDLLASLPEHGQLIPALVYPNGDGTYTLIDGNRRYTAHKKLGIKSMTCIVRDKADADAVFVVVNRDVKRPTGKDSLNVYLANPSAVTRKARADLSVWDRETLEYVAEHGGGVATLNQARTIANYAGTDKGETVRWLVSKRMTKMARMAYDGQVDARVFRAAINNNRPLKLEVAA